MWPKHSPENRREVLCGSCVQSRHTIACMEVLTPGEPLSSQLFGCSQRKGVAKSHMCFIRGHCAVHTTEWSCWGRQRLRGKAIRQTNKPVGRRGKTETYPQCRNISCQGTHPPQPQTELRRIQFYTAIGWLCKRFFSRVYSMRKGRCSHEP